MILTNVRIFNISKKSFFHISMNILIQNVFNKELKTFYYPWDSSQVVKRIHNRHKKDIK